MAGADSRFGSDFFPVTNMPKVTKCAHRTLRIQARRMGSLGTLGYRSPIAQKA